MTHTTCGKHMLVVEHERNPKKDIDRIVYECNTCNVLITVETGKETTVGEKQKP